MLAPVVGGLVPYTAIYDRTLKLVDFARMNDVLSARAENERRAREVNSGR